MQPLYIMMVARVVYFMLILIAAARHQWETVAVHVPIFVGTSLLPLFFRKNEWYWLDVYLMALFSSSLLFFTNRAPDIVLLSTDDLFHIAGGVACAWIALLFYRQYIREKWLLSLTVIAVALAIGAFWELFEWALTLLPGTLDVAHSGLDDSMMDLVSDTLGAALVAGAQLFKGVRLK